MVCLLVLVGFQSSEIDRSSYVRPTDSEISHVEIFKPRSRLQAGLSEHTLDQKTSVYDTSLPAVLSFSKIFTFFL